MKKILLATAVILGLTIGATAQTDAFFSDWSDFDNRGNGVDLPALPGEHGYTGNQSAPLGSGMLILTALGAGYAAMKRKEERD